MDWICRRGEWADKGIMWMSGAPGVGKSAILQTMCEALGVDDGSKSWLTKFGLSDRYAIWLSVCMLSDGYRQVDACYFFGRGLGDREKASFFPATIAYQLARSRMTFRDSINRTIADDASIMVAAFPSQFQQLVHKSVKAIWWFQYPATIIIDALDECDDADDQVQLLSLILEAVTLTRTRFLIASRPERHIHSFFQRKDISQHMYHIRLDEESFNTSRDIETFLRFEFARIRREKPELCLPLPNGEDWPGSIIIIRLRDDSDSQFIFPTLAVSFIDTPFYPPNQQLTILLAAPPPRAFSKLDALYERILSRCPPELREESDELVAYQNLVKGILASIITWSKPLSSTKIAEILNKKVDLVLNTILGPMRTLFKFDPTIPHSGIIMLCHKSLRDYVLAVERSHRFCITSKDADALFTNILLRQPHRDRGYSQDELKSVLMAMANWPGELTLPRIARILDVDVNLVANVVFGPAHSLFDEAKNGEIQISASSLKAFLHDDTRSGDFFIRAEQPDAVFIRILSTPPPSDPLHSYSRDDLLNVLAALVAPGGRTTKEALHKSLIGVDPSVFERVHLGPAKALFEMDSNTDLHFSTVLLKPFLRDATRSGEFFIRGWENPDAIFIRILSRKQPSTDPSQFHPREVLLDVLAVVVAVGNWVNVRRIAGFLDIPPSLVEGIIFGPSKVLFRLDRQRNIDFFTPTFKAFLLHDIRAGEFYTPMDKADTFIIRTLSLPHPYSRETLMDILTVLLSWPHRLCALQIAYALDIDPPVVEGVLNGPTGTRLFFYVYTNGDVEVPPPLRGFFQDPTRAGEFYIPTQGLDPKYDSIFAMIQKTVALGSTFVG